VALKGRLLVKRRLARGVLRLPVQAMAPATRRLATLAFTRHNQTTHHTFWSRPAKLFQDKVLDCQNRLMAFPLVWQAFNKLGNPYFLFGGKTLGGAYRPLGHMLLLC